MAFHARSDTKCTHARVGVRTFFVCETTDSSSKLNNMARKNDNKSSPSRRVRAKTTPRQKTVGDPKAFDQDELSTSLAMVEPGDTATLNNLLAKIEEFQAGLPPNASDNCDVQASLCLDA